MSTYPHPGTDRSVEGCNMLSEWLMPVEWPVLRSAVPIMLSEWLVTLDEWPVFSSAVPTTLSEWLVRLTEWHMPSFYSVHNSL